jgi:hypothetical protein
MLPKNLTAALAVVVSLLVAWPRQAVIINIVKNEPSDIYGTFYAATGLIESGVVEVEISKYLLENPIGLLPMVLEFQITPEQGDLLTRLDLHEEVHNETGIDWTDFEFYLVNLPDTHEAFAGAFFNNDGPPTSSWFGPPTTADDLLLVFDGAVIPDGIQDMIDDIWIEFTETLVEGNTYIFQLKQQPTPEPVSLILLSVLGVPLLPRRHHT